MENILHNFAVYVVPVVLAITLHEAAHAYVAKYFGDNTAYALGRMTLNPIKHIDPIGTVLIPLVLFVSGSPFIFGYAKPVPVNFSRLRKPKQDMAWVALAGPAANLIMGFLWLLMNVLLAKFGVNSTFLFQVAKAGVLINLVLFAFNLFPVLPLDGGRIVASLLPNRLACQFAKNRALRLFHCARTGLSASLALLDAAGHVCRRQVVASIDNPFDLPIKKRTQPCTPIVLFPACARQAPCTLAIIMAR